MGMRNLEEDEERGTMKKRINLSLIFSLSLCFALLFSSGSVLQDIPQSEIRIGQSATLLPDARWLLVGGEGIDGPLATASIWDPQTGVTTPLLSELSQPRSWHSSTMLPDGTILIFGGVGSDGQVLSSPELFDPNTSSFILPLSSLNLLPRSHHTTTLLTDGRVLIAGGVGADGQGLDFAELLDIRRSESSAIRIPQSAIRISGTATLLSHGTVLLWGGVDKDGNTLEDGDLFDPSSNLFVSISSSEIPNPQSEFRNPQLEASFPPDGSIDVPLDTQIALRFSKPLRVETVNADTVTLERAGGNRTNQSHSRRRRHVGIYHS